MSRFDSMLVAGFFGEGVCLSCSDTCFELMFEQNSLLTSTDPILGYVPMCKISTTHRKSGHA